MLLVAEEIAKSFTDHPIYVAGLGQGSGRGFHASDDLTCFEATRYSAQEAYGMSGLTPEDIQACFLFATKSLESTDFMPLMEERA